MTSETLHIINKSTTHSQLYSDCLACLGENDAVLLIESAVYSGCDSQQTFFKTLNIPVFALRTDAQARGVQDMMDQSIEQIDDSQFVELCCQYNKSISWF